MALIAVTACTSTKTTPVSETTPESLSLPIGIDPRIAASGDPAPPIALPAPPDLVWQALIVAYDSLGIRLGIYDPAQHLMGNQGMQVRQKVGKTLLSRYIECGSMQIGPSADSDDVLLSVITHVRVNENGVTQVATRVSASARPPTFAQNYTRCTSKGELEKRLTQFLSAALNAGH